MKYALIIFSVFLSGCMSKNMSEEKKIQMENALDISGAYKTTEDSEVQLDFTIANQNEKHDISIQMNRTSPLTGREKDCFSKLAKEYHVSVEALTTQPFPTSFGSESDFFGVFDDGVFDGLENISDDFGKTSKFNVCSDNSTKYESKKVVDGAKNVKLEILYCFSGTVRKANKNIIKGNLSLHAFFNYYVLSEGKDSRLGIGNICEVLNYKAEKK